MDSDLVNLAIRSFVTLLAVVDPVGNIPFFITATQAMPARERSKVALRASLVAAAVLLLCTFGGKALLSAFHVNMPAVRIGGGVILLVIALQMLSGRQFDWSRDRPAVEPGQARTDTGVVPLGIPLMAGPGAMSSVLVLTAQHGQTPLPTMLMVVSLAVMVVCLLGYLCYLSAVPLMARVGRTAMVTLSCLMGLILAALAVQFMLDGLAEAAPRLFAGPG